jgi:flagellar hook protein FlgE
MSSASAIGLSGMNVAQMRMDSAAHNIANVQTPRFAAQTTVQSEVPGGGVQAKFARLAPNPDGVEGNRLATDLVEEKMATYSFAANLKTVQTQFKVLGSLLNEKA